MILADVVLVPIPTTYPAKELLSELASHVRVGLVVKVAAPEMEMIVGASGAMASPPGLNVESILLLSPKGFEQPTKARQKMRCKTL